MTFTNSINPPVTKKKARFFIKWTPRLIIVFLTGYYSLGIAYDTGVMAACDRVAISLLKDWFGYVGIGAMMPPFQWYSAWAFRCFAGLCAGIIYDLLERLIRRIVRKMVQKPIQSQLVLVDTIQIDQPLKEKTRKEHYLNPIEIKQDDF